MTAGGSTLPRAPRRFRALIGWGILAVLSLFASRALDWRGVFDAIRTASPPWLVVSAIANSGILVLWAAFWRDLLPRGEPVGYATMFRISAIASAIMNTIPFMAGHASSVVLLVRRGNVTQHGALSVLALDQLGEGLAKVIIFAAVGALTPIPASMRAGILSASVAVAVLFGALIVLAYRHSEEPARASGRSLLARAIAFARRWAHALDTLRSPRRSANAMASVLAMKAAEAIGIIAVQRSFGVEIPFTGTLLVLAAILLATMIPIAPGNLGAYEASVWFVYDYLGVPSPTALALALVQHACFMVPSVGIGYLLLLRDARSAMASE